MRFRWASVGILLVVPNGVHCIPVVDTETSYLFGQRKLTGVLSGARWGRLPMCALWCGAYTGCPFAGPTGGFGATRSGQRMSAQSPQH